MKAILIVFLLLLPLPILQANDQLKPYSRKFGHNKRKDLQEKLVELLSAQAVYLHDYTFALVLEPRIPVHFSADNDLRVRQNAAMIGAAMFPVERQLALQLEILLVDYIKAGELYANLLTLISDLNDRLYKIDFFEWAAAGDRIALFLYQLNPEEMKFIKAQKRMKEYTNLQRDMAHNLVPGRTNFVEASGIYMKMRILAVEKLAPLFADAAYRK